MQEAPWRQLLDDAGIRSLSISATGVYKDDAATRVLEDMAMSGLLREFQLLMPHGDVWQGQFVVTAYTFTANLTGALTFDTTIESSSTIVLSRG